jgi:hypothetical protein
VVANVLHTPQLGDARPDRQQAFAYQISDLVSGMARIFAD